MADILHNLFPGLRMARITLQRRFPNFLHVFICTFFIFTVFLGLYILSDSNDQKDYDEVEEVEYLNENDHLKRSKNFNNQLFESTAHHSFTRSHTGPGEMGKPVYLNGSEADLANELFPKESFNIVASDKISLERSVPEFRHEQCLDIVYDKDLPVTSVIIIFHNEAWSTLMRTVYSVYNRAPPHLLHEIILVDDYSYREDIREKLDHYLATHFNGKAQIIRLKERSGLIRARLAGARKATGEVLLFLDSHCETSEGWLEPLLARIKENRTIVVAPTMDNIKTNTLEIRKSRGASIGIFDWKLNFHWKTYDHRYDYFKKHPTEPIKSPTMAGGLFAIDRKYFWEMGSYDEEMKIWGGENIEMSFRIWMCGGSLEIVPCSRVAHLFREKSPYTYPGKKNTLGPNLFRVAEVWLDDYKEIFYQFHLQEKRKIKYGDVTSRIALRKRLKCHSFKWYLQNVYPEKFIINENVFAWGSVQSGSLCFDTMGKKEKVAIDLHLYLCFKTSSNQIFSYSKTREIRREDMCLDATGRQKSFVKLVNCHGHKGNQEWIHMKHGAIIHVPTKKCIDRESVKIKGRLILRKCNGSPTQKWKFRVYLEDKDEEK